MGATLIAPVTRRRTLIWRSQPFDARDGGPEKSSATEFSAISMRIAESHTAVVSEQVLLAAAATSQ